MKDTMPTQKQLSWESIERSERRAKAISRAVDAFWLIGGLLTLGIVLWGVMLKSSEIGGLS